ncbi:Bro-N domain-containing protein [Stutzerimonas stutzeri]|uniref:BRO-N domain-containing protein n=1 Tax=Stutzerimonas stutzeri TaxID=316 RepID=UPI000F7A33F2|nr:BRO family protein [Stutzerimonas stutzeri]RRV80351.1 phage repressor protein [Stutzerimonas stutzeri]
MDKFNTASGNVIPFSFGAQPVRALLDDDRPWFFAKDVCTALALMDTNKALIGLDDEEKREHEQYSGSGRKPVLINESGLYSLILRSRKAEAKRFKKWVTAEVLPAIRKHGRYSDDSGKMATLVNDVIGVSGANLIGGVISQKVSVLPVGVQRQARHRMHSVLHTRFNVPRTELIPAEKLDAACQYIAAYVLEGEWLESSQAKGMQLSEREVQALYLMMSHYHFAMEWAMKSGIYAIARMTDSRPLSNFNEHFSEIGMGFRTLDERRDEIYRIYSQRGAGGGYAMQAAS